MDRQTTAVESFAAAHVERAACRINLQNLRTGAQTE